MMKELWKCLSTVQCVPQIHGDEDDNSDNDE